MAGTLTLVATPIGNLGDITLRALEVLRAADVVASEDTRKTGLLLKHFEIKKPQIAFHEHNERQAVRRLIGLLEGGQSVALVTDAGTPGISDPGYSIVRRALDAGIEVTMAPGPAGLIMAVVLSGLPVHSFTYRGFPPRKPGPRRRFIGVDKDSPHTLIYYESPHRLEAFLADAQAVLGDREAAIANDLTKLFERVDRGRLSALREALADSKIRGEYMVVIAGNTAADSTSADEADTSAGSTSAGSTSADEAADSTSADEADTSADSTSADEAEPAADEADKRSASADEAAGQPAADEAE